MDRTASRRTAGLQWTLAIRYTKADLLAPPLGTACSSSEALAFGYVNGQG
jgi:hypothetical protein